MIVGKPTASQEKAWLARVAQFAQDHGAFPNYEGHFNYQLHHVGGREFKNNKVHIGRWFVLPIEFDYHDLHSNNDLNVTHFRKRYVAEFGAQRDQFAAMCAVIKVEDDGLPFSDDVYYSIVSTSY